MKSAILRLGAVGAMFALTACSGSINSKPFNQDEFKASLTTYLSAAAVNFAGFSAKTALVGTSECGTRNAGAPGAKAECKLAEGYDNQADAMVAYTEQKDHLTEALPADARSIEQKDAVPNTPLRFAAIEGKGAVVLVLTKSAGKWVVAYEFQKVP